MPSVNSKEEKKKIELTDKKAANKWMIEAKDNPPNTVKTPKAKELLLWKKLTEGATKEVNKEDRENK